MRFVGHPFKRRKRRQTSGIGVCQFGGLVVLLLGVVFSTVTDSFVTPPSSRPSAWFGQHDSVHCAFNVRKATSVKRRGQLSPLRTVDQASDDGDAPLKVESNNSKSYRISPEQLDLIKDSVDLVSVVESYGLPGFQRQGNNRAKAVCPFHDDHNPSMSVDGGRGIYKCFACGAGGDVFNFVREYSALKAESMTFYRAVRHVAQEFGDPNLKLDFISSSQPRITDEERNALNEKKQRLLLANAAAAAYYAKCLITMPAAGVARSHIQERGMSPTTAKAFAMGYAPDAYFRAKVQWGTGSLVHHLRDLGFKPSEIIEAGLATRTKRSQVKSSSRHGDIVNATADDVENADNDYDTLIDRFRNRLVVPIFDSRGSNVLGFGARILPPEEMGSSGYKAPKYMNSPESLVFQKKNVLFGQHFASEAVRETRKFDKSKDIGPDRGSIMIVEGYMDAMSLWEAGIHEVVASMGTALTMEQLSSAARTAGTHGGRIVLCFDGDEAGSNAIERLCTGPLLSKTAETYVVEILVATLPGNFKDPSEYIESKSSVSKARAGDEFRNEVVDSATDWTVWYLEKLLSRYDERSLRGTAGSFADTCDRVSEFLSRFPNPLERTKRAHDVAGSLADIVSGRSQTSGGASKALRIQLETDLVNMVARKAEMRESIERRLEVVDGYSEELGNGNLAKMTRGGGVSTPPDNTSKLSTRALKALKRGTPVDDESEASKIGLTSEDTSNNRGRRGRARLKRASKKSVQPSLTPHFSGFDFEFATDLDWLNLPREKWKRKKGGLTLGTAKDGQGSAKAKSPRSGEDHESGVRVDNLVYFNSNEYHGGQFLTEEARDAGYCNGEVARDASIFERGLGTLVLQDAPALVDAAEIKLLKNIVNFERARKAMIHSLETSDATDSRNRIEWSRPERAWLFDRLVRGSNLLPNELLNDGRLCDKRTYLLSLSDAPAGAFSAESISPTPDVDSTVHVANRPPPINLENLSQTGSFSVPEIDISKSSAHSAHDIDSSLAEANYPSDHDDIESWAASYDPSAFDDTNSAETEQEGTLRTAEADPVYREMEKDEAKSPGCLDIFFSTEEDLFAATYDDSVSRELRAELEVQEAHATLLMASALKQLNDVKEEWLAVSARMEKHESAVDVEAENSPKALVDLNSMTDDDVEEYSTTLIAALRDLSETVCRLGASAKRIGSRLMDYSNADGIEGQLSVAQQEGLASMVNNHLESLPQDWKAPEIADVGNMERSHNNRDPMLGWGDDNSLDRVLSFEDDMAQLTEDWGEWADDDFVWSPENELDPFKLSTRATETVVPTVLDMLDDVEEDNEPLDEALQRLDSEWSHWETDDNLDNGSSIADKSQSDIDDAPSGDGRVSGEIPSYEDVPASTDDPNAEFESIFE